LFLRFSDEEQELEKRNLVMYKRFIVLLGIFLGSHAPAAAQAPAVQAPAVQIVLAHAYVTPADNDAPARIGPFAGRLLPAVPVSPKIPRLFRSRVRGSL
jgi:hypothetical protein